jgi:hypothetical protein
LIADSLSSSAAVVRLVQLDAHATSVGLGDEEIAELLVDDLRHLRAGPARLLQLAQVVHERVSERPVGLLVEVGTAGDLQASHIFERSDAIPCRRAEL